MAGMIKLMLVDDRTAIRAGLVRILNQAPGIEVIAEVSAVRDVLPHIAGCRPEVLLLDFNMREVPSLEAIQQLSSAVPDLRVLVVTDSERKFLPEQLWRAGVSGYLGRGCPVGEMVSAIKLVREGHRYPMPGALSARSGGMHASTGTLSPFALLMPREMQLMQLLIKGLSIDAIAETWDMNRVSICTLNQRLYEKLHISCLDELLRLVSHHGLLDSAVGE